MATTRFADHLLIGDHASRPAATAVPAGGLYSCTTHNKIYQSNGTSWSDYVTSLVGPTGATGPTGPTGATGASGSAASVSSDTIWDTKGDLAVATGADAAAKLPVGSNGQLLTADSTQTTGLKWAAAAGGGAWTLLSSTTLGSAGTFDITSISGSYNDLIVVAIVRGAQSGSGETLKITLNNDTAAHYYREGARQAGTGTVAAQENIGAAYFSAEIPASTSSLANAFGIVQMTIYGYASTTWKKVVEYTAFQPLDTATFQLLFQHFFGLWDSTAAVTRVTVVGNSTANMVTGSQLRIYGRL
jgi:hypothetical protein